MEIGPFNILEVETVTELLKSKNVSYEVLHDQAAEQELIAKHNEQARSAPRAAAGKLNLKTIYFEIDEQDFDKLATDLEKWGIVKPSDGSFELGED